jgi:2-amino-4-hydroxy-6-hydroxymethyldihydropteridine diphosphokinase
MPVVFLGLGSNLGDRKANLSEALRRIAASPGVTLGRVSRFRESAPWGVTDQPDFLNAVVSIETTLAPKALLSEMKAIERAMGRQPSRRWGPRLIDIDLLIYEGVRMQTPALTLPHPEIMRREFVREPLREISPELFDATRPDAFLVEEIGEPTANP